MTCIIPFVSANFFRKIFQLERKLNPAVFHATLQCLSKCWGSERFEHFFCVVFENDGKKYRVASLP